MVKLENPKEVHVQAFTDASNSFRQIAEKLGIFFNSAPLNFADHLKSLDSYKIQNATERLIFYKTLCEQLIEECVEENETQYLWYAIHRLGWVPPSDLFSKIMPNECFEIFDKHGVQVYRSFNFAKYTTYSLDEILNYPWHELYTRDESILSKMQLEAADVLSGRTKGPRPISVPEHICEETLSINKWKTKVKFKYISPLYSRKGEVAGFIATCDLSRCLN